jgi:ankyrin repeat protein
MDDNEMTAESANALIAAIDAGDLERVHDLIAADRTIAAARDATGVSAMLYARYRGRNDIADSMLAADPPLDLFDAVGAGRADRAEALLDADPDAVHSWSADGFTALHLAAFFGRLTVSTLLIARGADVNATSRNPMRVRPLHSAAAARASDVVGLLLVNGADANATQERGITALMSAAAGGDVESIRLLLEHGADAAARDADGKTAADYAHEARSRTQPETPQGEPL